MFKHAVFLVVTVFALLFSTAVLSAVRYNPITGFWEGNICLTQWGWAWYKWQPIGSYCTIRMPNGQFVTGIIANN